MKGAGMPEACSRVSFARLELAYLSYELTY